MKYKLIAVIVFSLFMAFIGYIFILKAENESHEVLISKDSTQPQESFKSEVTSHEVVADDNSVKPKKHALDPETDKSLKKMLNTSSDGLVEVEMDDGVMVDLKDRFRAVPVAQVNENGEVTVIDYVSPPAN